VKAVSDVYTPVSGKVVEVNEDLADDPGAINADAYGKGWLCRVELTDEEELDGLMSAEAYERMLEQDED
jgi:glycine cleavage system H protein